MASNNHAMVIERVSTSLEYTNALATGFAACLRPGDIVELVGDLGAGKTTFTRSVAAALGVPPGMVSSPTFVFVNVYPCEPKGPRTRAVLRLVHIDAYRVSGLHDLEALGWDTLFVPDGSRALGEGVALIEWADRISGAFAGVPARVTMASLDEESRGFRFALPEEWGEREDVRRLAEREPRRCRTTGKWVSPSNPSYPFFDERARMADLNMWFTESHTISREIREGDDAHAAEG